MPVFSVNTSFIPILDAIYIYHSDLYFLYIPQTHISIL